MFQRGFKLFSRPRNQTTEVSQKKKNNKESSDNENRVDDSNNEVSITEKFNEKDSTLIPDNSSILPKKNKKQKKKSLNQSDKSIERLAKPDKQKRKLEQTEVLNNKRRKVSSNSGDKNPSLKSKKKSSKTKSFKPKEESSLSKMSDARLLAYGIKPKQFRNKLKYNSSKS